MNHLLTAILLAAPLAACSSGGTPAGDAMPMNATRAMTDMPQPDGRSFVPHMLPLYPGSKMVDMKIMAHTQPDDMAYSFTSPAALDAVRSWYRGALAKAGITATETATGFMGKDKSVAAFVLALSDGPNGATSGTITSGN